MIIPIEYVSAAAASVALNGNNVAGDYIFVFAYDAVAVTIPTLAAGYTNIVNGAGTGQAMYCAFKVSTGGEVTTGTWTNATYIVAMVFRNVLAIGATPAINPGNSAILNYSAVTLQVANGTSWVIGFGGAVSVTAGMNGVSTGALVNRTSQLKVNGLEAPQVLTSVAQTMTVTTTGRWLTVTFEIKAVVDPVVGGNLAGGIL